ncbi:MAG: type IV pilus assembly protein PilM [Jatrophihabitantaceae bacterium]
MKHRQIGIGKVGVVNPDGHAIGLDIGATAVRASILAPGTLEGRPSVTIHGVGRIDLPSGVVVNGVVQEPAALTAAIKQLWSVNKFEGHNVILGIANQQVLVRDLTVPNLDPIKRAKALPFQAKEIVALPIDQVVLDFCQLGAPDPQTNMVRGLLLATPREPVRIATGAVARAGLRVARVDLSAFGTLRAIGDEHLAVEAVVDLGAHLTTIVIHDHGVPKLVRTLARGGELLTEQLADRLSVSIPEAEHIKWEAGLEGAPEVARGLLEGLRPLVAEVRTSVGYFRSTNDGAVIERISLTGGGAHLRGIAAALSDGIGLPTRVIDPLQHVRNRHASKQTRGAESAFIPSAVSLGLAMGAAA